MNFDIMKKPNIAVMVLLPFLLASCGPLSYTVGVELRQPTRSGLELSGKTLSVAYLDDGNPLDSTFIASVSEGFAQRLESEYFGGEPLIQIFNIDKVPGADYSSRDSVINVLMDTGTDVVFVFDSPVLGDVSLSAPQKVETPVVRDSSYLVEASIPYSLRLYVYDSMNSADKVFTYSGSAVANPVAYTGGNETDDEIERKALDAVASPANDAGRVSGGPFLPVWNEEKLTFLYYDAGNMSWLQALAAAHEYRWQEAIGIWMKLTDTGNLMKRSCAAYNLAVAFYILGQYDIAGEWLDISDSDYPVHMSYSLREKIKERK